MSKPNRRRPRPGSQPSTPRPIGGPAARPAGSTGTGGTAGTAETTGPGTTDPGASSAGAATSSGTPRTPGTTARPTAVRHGRRERQRAAYQPSFMERYRTAIVVVAAVAGVALLSFFVFFSASQPAYACSQIWAPSATPAPAASATPNLGYVQPDMGNSHVTVGTKVTYTYCAPASGSHDNTSGLGPIAARVYSPTDKVLPEGWIHNLEHGALVILYKGTSAGATADGQTQFKTFLDSFPNSPRCGLAKGLVGPVIARFDEMSTPFQAILWGRVLPLETFDQAQILTYYQQWGDRSNPEDQCPTVPRAPTTSASPSLSAAPSAVPSASPVPGASAAPSAS